MPFRATHIVILLCGLLCACGNVPPHAAFSPEARGKVSTTEVVMPIRQAEIYVYVPPAQGGAGFGLIGALIDVSIDSVRAGKAETAVKPLRDAVVDYNFDDVFKGEITHSLSAVPWMGAGTFRVIKEVTPDTMEKALTNSQAGAVLFIAADYNLSNDGDELTVKLYASLFPNNDDLRALKPVKKDSKGAVVLPANALYRNVFTYKTRIPPAPNGRDGTIAVWSANNGAAARAALGMAAAKLARLLAEDIQRTEEDGAAAAKAGTPVKIEGLSGQSIGSDADGTVVRLADGTLAFVTPSMLAP
jgi:hypothetical protein